MRTQFEKVASSMGSIGTSTTTIPEKSEKLKIRVELPDGDEVVYECDDFVIGTVDYTYNGQTDTTVGGATSIGNYGVAARVMMALNSAIRDKYVDPIDSKYL